jgi:hypothetical protein
VLDFLIELLVLLDQFFVLYFQFLRLLLRYSFLLLNFRNLNHCIHLVDFLLTDELKGQEFKGRSGVSKLKIDDGFFVWAVAQMIFNMNCNLFLDVLQVDFFPTSKFLDAVKTENHADLERWILVVHMKLVAGIDF